MPGRLVWAIYVTDDNQSYAKLADETEVGDPNRGWERVDNPFIPVFPRGAKPRMVYGYSSTTGRRGHTIVAHVGAPLWQTISGVNSFNVSAEDSPTGIDTLQVTSRVGERWPRPTVSVPPEL